VLPSKRNASEWSACHFSAIPANQRDFAKHKVNRQARRGEKCIVRRAEPVVSNDYGLSLNYLILGGQIVINRIYTLVL
jgi:hypothetical protein